MTDDSAYQSPGLGCAMCGHCCEHVYLSDPDRLREWAEKIRAGMPDPADDDAWRDYWLAGPDRPHGPRDTPEDRASIVAAYHNARRIFLEGLWQEMPAAAPPGFEGMMPSRYRCTVYDAEHRRCGDHANRPPICRLAPWYADDPVEYALRHGPPYGRAVADAATGEPLACSYQLDVPPELRSGRTLIPIEVL